MSTLSKRFEITCRINGSDYELFKSVVNQGIDSHLQGFTESKFSYKDSRLVMDFALVELPILVRRLDELGTEEAELWSQDIQDTEEFRSLAKINAKNGVQGMGTIEISKDSIEIEYLLVDESFDHEFGLQKQTGYSVERVTVYVADLQDWIDVTCLDDNKLNSEVTRLIEMDMSQRGMK